MCLDVQQKLFGFENFNRGKAKKRNSKTRSRTKEQQSKFDVGDYNDPQLRISDDMRINIILMKMVL